MPDVHNSSSSINPIKSNYGSKNILQLITCPICLEVFREPIQLPCQHNFCKSCLERITVDRWSRFFREPIQLPCQHNFCKSCLERITVDRWSRCPVCRGCYRVPFAGVGSFEVNRTIINLLENNSYTESRPMLQAKCALCKLEDTITVNSFYHSSPSSSIDIFI
ncbi:unnamed protein product [Rotaria magnacalcarata]|uniref:RING-type domain-containing protein n=1 Tax=Rotaria magnacalcarata TaxID=392030 RepID=A0A816ZU27_9BILA|nr:unnamed protein product [Rotaria magnacalcarata]